MLMYNGNQHFMRNLAEEYALKGGIKSAVGICAYLLSIAYELPNLLSIIDYSASLVIMVHRPHPFSPASHVAAGASGPGLQPLRGCDQTPPVDPTKHTLPICCTALHWLYQVCVCVCVCE